MHSLDKLQQVMAQLRSPQGCTWDRQQDHASLTPFLLEEAYEVLDTIEQGAFQELREELGDLLLQIVFHSQIADEEGLFNLTEVVEGITQKMIRRHPHLFDAEGAFCPKGEDKPDWEALKKEEYPHRDSILDGIPKALPALARAQKVQKKAAKVGFDWPDTEGPRQKVVEETAEVEAEIEKGDARATEEEFGDLLFAMVNWGRHLGVNTEEALRHATTKFERRFRHVEKSIDDLSSSTLEEMDKAWDDAKEKGL